jgi:hypothetical protein
MIRNKWENMGQGVVTHAFNPNELGSRDYSSKPTGAKVSKTPSQQTS